tara:strand:- start:4401 stop:4790 length:390 start_codon:yes stop_codon:yes gene_type:complete
MGSKSSPFKIIEDILETTTKGIGDTINTGTKTINDTSNQVGRLDKIILSPSNAAEEGAKDADRADTRQREQAIRDQKQASSDLTRQQASNEDTSRGSSIILGKKGKKNKKGSSVSGGLGLSTGSTGLQT